MFNKRKYKIPQTIASVTTVINTIKFHILLHCPVSGYDTPREKKNVYEAQIRLGDKRKKIVF